MQWRVLAVIALVAALPFTFAGTNIVEPKTEICSLEPEVGPCKGSITRLFYNSTSKQCEKFIYGGCGGNENNFDNIDDCLQQCHVCPVEGQVYSTCASPCTFTCDNVNELGCIAQCTTGCDCPGGQVIDTEINKCVPVKDCPNSNGSCLAGGGKVIRNGETSGDTCSSCTCIDGNLACFIIDCAFPDCDNYYIPEGACCPECLPLEVEACVYNGELHSPGDVFVALDDCNMCSCLEGGAVTCTNTRRCRRLRKLSCPQNILGIGHCAIQCEHDSDCKDLHKCCKNACGGTQCVRGKRRRQKPNCAAVLCPVVDCPNATIPEGECCAVCPPTLPPKCAYTLCLAVDCPGATIPEGECCPVCPPILPPKCASVQCVAVECLHPIVPEGECCPVCPPTATLPPECAAIHCIAVGCLHPIVPEGECCPVCPPMSTLPPECASVQCAAVECLHPIVPEGQCCPVCPPTATLPPECAAIHCIAVGCPYPIVPEGECCPVCPKYRVCEYNGQTYLPGDTFPATDGCNSCACFENGQVACTEKACFPGYNCSLEPEVGTCRGYIPRFFYNSTSNQCEEFIYGGCGGNENNFLTIDECLQTCRSGECRVEGQVYSTCASPCTFTCDNVNEQGCLALCTTGCDCPGGRVIDTEINKCVPIEECPNINNGSCLAGNGKVIANGETTGDGCSSCTCIDGRLACFEIQCAFPDCFNSYIPEGACCPVCPPTEVEVCVYNGQLHSPGDVFVALDDCNMCSCLEGGLVSCTDTRRCRRLSKLSCPQTPFGIGDCAIQCENDYDCKGLRKCCTTECGGTQCIRGKRRRKNPNCAAVLCPAVDCPNAIIPKGECCAVCPGEFTLPPKCASVLCLAVDCPGAVIPEGECCAVCPPILPPKCAGVLCVALDCPGAMIPEGECCAVCPTPSLPPKCAGVLCLAVDCPGAVVPEGECCPVCPNVCEYNGQTYNPGDSFPSSDGCNSCFCSAGGQVGCTEIACVQKLVCPTPTGFGICVEDCAVGIDCGPGMKCCSNGCGHVCMNATDCALVDCETPSCDFPGGVVVPAGEDECCPTCGCRFGNDTYRVGDSFPAGDGCNTCSCQPGGTLCTLIACEEPKNVTI